MTDEVLVSVCTVTYNHKDYIIQALDGFLMQKTNFKFQVIIGDDCSTDGTTEILKEYAEKYPDIIKPVFREKNIGAFNNSQDIYRRITTKYAAYCDGDDYWTDPYKLQKQFDFMEANPEFSVCTHVTKRIYEPPELTETYVPYDFDFETYKGEYSEVTFQDILKGLYFHSSSLFLRWNVSDKKFELPKEAKYGDIYLLTWFSKFGKVKFLPELMSIYRCNLGGVYAKMRLAGEIAFDNWTCMNRISLIKTIYNNVVDDKEWYFKEVFYPQFADRLSMLFKGRDWKTLFSYLSKNADIVFLILKHWQVMKNVIGKDIIKLLRRIFKVLKNKSN